MKARIKAIGGSVHRITIGVMVTIVFALAAYALWHPGLDIRDGRNDRGSNAVWLAHGWLGSNEWFVKNTKTNDLSRYRNPTDLLALAAKLRQHEIIDVFPHLCPAEPTGALPGIDEPQVERFLDAFKGFRVLPWVGGPNGANVRLRDLKWRKAFAGNVHELMIQHPRFAGIHLNVEPVSSGDTDFLALLDELHAVLPTGKLLSVAAYPPPTRWQTSTDVHWNESYFREVAKRSDQVAVMMYDVGQRIRKTYQRLMADWTVEVLHWSEGKAVLLGVPTYDDAGTGYHRPFVENLPNALLGIHRGLLCGPIPANYQGVAIYCEWETSDEEWRISAGTF